MKYFIIIIHSRLSIPSEFDFYNDKGFKTPARVDRLHHSAKKVSPSGSFIGSVKKASPKTNPFYTALRRLTRFQKSSSKKTINRSPENSVLLNESQLINSQSENIFPSDIANISNYTLPEPNETNNFPLSEISHKDNCNSLNQVISFDEPELQNSNIIRRNIKQPRKCNSNSFTFIDESPNSLETENNHESFISKIDNNNEKHDINESFEFSNIEQPNNSLNYLHNTQQRKFAKRKSGTGSNIKNKNRKF